jgi:hypothetical protein
MSYCIIKKMNRFRQKKTNDIETDRKNPEIE